MATVTAQYATAYGTYKKLAIAAGETPMTEAEWLESLKGEKGDLGGIQAKSEVTFSGTWSGTDPYTQTVTISKATATSFVSLQPTLAQIAQLRAAGVKTLRVDNDNGVLTATAEGGAPTTAMTMQCTLSDTEPPRGGGVTINPLTVTENGVYEAESGSAYSPVTVNVQNPSTGALNISANGTYDVTEKASAVVNVQPTLQSKTATANGTVSPDSGYDGLSQVVVNVQPTLQSKTVTANGTVQPDSGYDGLSQVVVNVPSTTLNPLSVTANGTYTPTSGTGYSTVTVAIPVYAGEYQ